MDFSQKKLTKAEWEAIEVPLPKNEQEIFKLVINAYDDVNYSFNKNRSLVNIMKLDLKKIENLHIFIFVKYFKQSILHFIKEFKLPYELKQYKLKHNIIKKADKIRIENTEKKLDHMKKSIFEYELMSILEDFFNALKRNKKDVYYCYYTLLFLKDCSISNCNTILLDFITFVLDYYDKKDLINKKILIQNAYKYIEKNQTIYRYSNVQLYKHQKELFTLVKNKNPKIILYQAPTGTGKTISPLGLANEYKIIFVCAAKHVGLQLAKSCVSTKIPLAIAFGCNDPGDVRLHYNAAKDIVRNYKTGGIFRVDNSNGIKVKIIISDVQSYLCAMNYMTAFNKPEQIITFWDEPTISLDYEEHEFHSVLKNNWEENIIPNIILSSATLPSFNDIAPMIQKFKSKFVGCENYNIISYDCKKTIPILNKTNYVCLPHLIYNTKKDIISCIKHCKSYKTLLRHFDIQEITQFLKYVFNNNLITKERYQPDVYFENVNDINIINIKVYYLDILRHIASVWKDHYQVIKRMVKPRLTSSIKITTTDAHTLTDGPTIYIADNVELIAKYCLKIANIPQNELKTVQKNISYNAKIIAQLEIVEKQLKEFTDKVGDKKIKDTVDGASKTDSSIINDFNTKIQYLKNKVKIINLSKHYIPNTIEHKKKYASKSSNVSFGCDIHDSIIEKIMLTSVPTIWKTILMLGIGVFTKFDDVEYLEIMKSLANDQKLFMIIASSDYIYGTNYQFCHGYIGKDIIENMTQEKAIQAFGRIGRQNAQQDYSIRLRSDDLIQTIFQKQICKKEVINMNKLFG